MKQSNFTGQIAAIAYYEDKIKKLQKLGVDSVFNIYKGAGLRFAELVCDVLKPIQPEFKF